MQNNELIDFLHKDLKGHDKFFTIINKENKMPLGTYQWLFYTIPYKLLTHRYFNDYESAVNGIEGDNKIIPTITLEYDRTHDKAHKNSPVMLSCRDSKGSSVRITLFHIGCYLKLKKSDKIIVKGGKYQVYNGIDQIANPNISIKKADYKFIEKIEPIYSFERGNHTLKLQNLIRKSLTSFTRPIKEWLPASVIEDNGWEDHFTCLKVIHCLIDNNSLARWEAAYDRLCLDEIYSFHLGLGLIKHESSLIIDDVFEYVKQTDTALQQSISSFEKRNKMTLSMEQIEAIKTFTIDIASTTSMRRLLQGDVGVGKTIPAFFAMIECLNIRVKEGYQSQSAMLCPSTILAMQNYNKFCELFPEYKDKACLLRSKIKKSVREPLLEGIANGAHRFVFGTHAIIQEAIEFSGLAVAVIDEQHKFGTEQRQKLRQKSIGRINMLSMSATPIPRSLCMIQFGDMDITTIKQIRPGSIENITALMEQSDQNVSDILDKAMKSIKDGNQVYWVCPMVEENEEFSIQSAVERLEIIQNYPGFENVNSKLIHGDMKSVDKDSIMKEFKDGDISMLIATTVIEVGVDMPNANIMIVEDAERFGLAQLHQLRGRVGRGNKQGYFLMLYSDDISQESMKRLKVIRNSNDGFHIAEQDLKARGSGNFLTDDQVGKYDLEFGKVYQRIADIAYDIIEKVVYDNLTAEQQDALNLFSTKYTRKKYLS